MKILDIKPRDNRQFRVCLGREHQVSEELRWHLHTTTRLFFEVSE